MRSPAQEPDSVGEEGTSDPVQRGALVLQSLSPDRFGGVWLDGERVVFCWVGTDDVPRDVIARVRMAVEDRLTMFVPVRHSWAELTALTDRLNSAAGQLRERGVTMTSWGPDVLSNRVVVTFDRYSPSAEEELRVAFPGEPLMVSAEGVVPDPAGRRTEYGPQ